MDIKNWIILGICLTCIISVIFSNNRYKRLENEFQQYKHNSVVVGNGYVQENERLHEEIKLLQEDLDICYLKLDSLKHLKQEIHVDEFIVSKNIVSGADLLRENLECERFYR